MLLVLNHSIIPLAGNIRSGSTQAESMPASDLAKRDAAIAEKKKKLVSPLFFVSATRLSVRNLAKSVDDAKLKTLAKQVRLNPVFAAGLCLETLAKQERRESFELQ